MKILRKILKTFFFYTYGAYFSLRSRNKYTWSLLYLTHKSVNKGDNFDDKEAIFYL